MYVFRSRVRSLSFTVRCRCSFPYAMFCRAAPRGSTLGSRSGGAVDAAAELLDREVRQHRHQYGRRDAPGRCDEVRVAGAGNGCHAVDDAESGSAPQTTGLIGHGPSLIGWRTILQGQRGLIY